MLESILDFYRILTTPERLIQLLTTLLSGWLSYAALFAIVFSETGLPGGPTRPFLGTKLELRTSGAYCSSPVVQLLATKYFLAGPVSNSI